MVTAADQQALEKHELKPNHKSAYDYQNVHEGDGERQVRRSSREEGA